jgi:hypothetical protein
MAVRRSALLVVALVFALLPAASAAGPSYSTKIIVSLKFPAFHGSLKSSKNACVSDRKVKLYRKKTGSKKLLGTDKSNAEGKWAIPIGKRLTSGAYYAKASAKGSCKPSKSKVLTID